MASNHGAYIDGETEMTEQTTKQNGDSTVGNDGLDILRETTVGQFRGDFPTVPTAEGVDIAQLGDLDDKPLYVTLPIVPNVGTVSKNGLLYDDGLLSEIEQQIVDKRPGANFGHIADAERDTAFPKPDAIWVGAKRDGDTLWGKAYVRPGAARDYIRTLIAVRGKIATSIFGRGQYENVSKNVRRLTKFDLDTLDFAPPSRAALGGGMTPIVTAEMSDDDTKDDIMDRNEIIAGLTVNDIPDALREQIVADANDVVAAENRVNELTQEIADRDSQIADLTTAVAEFRQREFSNALDATISELFSEWTVTGDEATEKFDALQRTIRSRVIAELDGDTSEDSINEAIDAVWEDVKPLAETVRDALAGPSAAVGGKQPKPRLVDTPETRAAARRKFTF